MIQPKPQHQPSPMSETTLWHLYRRLLSEKLLGEHLERDAQESLSSRHHAGPAANSGAKSGAKHGQGWGIAAALSENLLPGDTVGLAADDLATRYLCGVPLGRVKEAAQSPAAKRMGRRGAAVGWAHPADAQYGLLPGTGEEQASLALGTALSSRLHGSGSVTVLVSSCMPASSGRPTRKASDGMAWAQAARTAVALQLPLLLVSCAPSPEAFEAQPNPRRAAPSLPSIPVDRDDALALYRVIYESTARARSGGGPTWIECRAWELPHDARRTSPLDKPAAARETALEKMEVALRARKLFNSQQQRHLLHALEKEFAQAGWPPSARS